jgi:hypothetical protein
MRWDYNEKEDQLTIEFEKLSIHNYTMKLGDHILARFNSATPQNAGGRPAALSRIVVDRVSGILSQKGLEYLGMSWACIRDDATMEELNHNSESVAERLLKIAETGKHPGTFGGEKLEACAQAILELRERARYWYERYGELADNPIFED